MQVTFEAIKQAKNKKSPCVIRGAFSGACNTTMRKINRSIAKAARKAKAGKGILLVSGKRGMLARLTSWVETKLGLQVTALQNNLGLSLKKATPATIVKGILTGPKQALLELGGYVNGRMTGAKAELVPAKTIASQAKVGMVKWTAESSDFTPCLYLGNANEKGVCAVFVLFGTTLYAWQGELDSNCHNKGERVKLTALADCKGAEQAVCKAGAEKIRKALYAC